MTIGIAVMHLGRCGSTVLGNLLGQHSRITWRGEILEPLFQAARKQHGDHFFMQGDPAELAAKVLENCASDYAGVEFKPFHLAIFRVAPSDFISRLRSAGFRHFIVLDRRNRLRKIVSSRLAANSGVWHVPINTVRDSQAIMLDVECLSLDRKVGSLADVLGMYDAEFDELRRLLSPGYLDLVYEDDIEADPQVAYRKVIDFLGLAAEPVATKLGRTTTAPLRGVIENFDTVERHLEGTRYAWMLDG